ncbi:PBP1A family penicillin-binding protein [Ligilactobacillus sp. LYQ135]
MKNSEIKEWLLNKWQIFWHWFKAKWHRYQIWKWLLIVFLSVFLVVSIRLVYIAKTSNVDQLKARLQQATLVYDSSGKKAGSLYSQKGTWVPLSKISKNVPDAVLSTEDRNFYHEYGFSIKGIARAGVLLVRNRILGQDTISGGGSTITQQLVKNAFLSQEQTFSRKAKEIFIAMQVENTYSKNEILTMYLNNAYFGNGVWGVQDAAKRYFGVSASQLTVPQAATLAGMLTNPSGFNPTDHPEASKKRRNLVLQMMYENKKISKSEMETYQQTPMVTHNTYNYESGYNYPYYFDAVINEAINEYDLSEKEIMNGGYKIYTSLDQSQQKVMQQAFANPNLFPAAQVDGTQAQASSIAIDPDNGGVTALVGGRSGTHVFRGYNRATQLVRSPGSTIKPLAVYTPALENGYHYDSMVEDKLQSYGSNKYTPHNWNNVYQGKIPMYEALALSKNTSAVWLLNKIGVQKGYDSVEKFGIKLSKSDDNLSLALGGLKKGVSPYQIASAYTAFANNGVRYEPHLITKIEDPSGKVIVDNTKIKHKRVMSKKVAKEMTSMMIDVYTQGTGVSAKPSGYTIAGKTGSTQSTDDINQNGNAEDDHWFVGYTPDVVVATWMGYDSDKYSLSEYGADEGAGLFKTEMEGIIPTTKQTSFNVQAASTLANKASQSSSSSSSSTTNDFWSNVVEAGKNFGNAVQEKANEFKQQLKGLFN